MNITIIIVIITIAITITIIIYDIWLEQVLLLQLQLFYNAFFFTLC